MPYKNPEDRKRRARERAQADPQKRRSEAYRWREENPERWQAIQQRSLKKRSKTGQLAANKQTYYERHSEEIKARTRRHRLHSYEKYLVTRLRRKAEEHGLPFDLAPEDITIPDVCPVLGITLRKEGLGQRDDSPSVDRLVPSLGYVRGNVRIISKRANQIKNCATIREVELVLAYMKENLGHDHHAD